MLTWMLLPAAWAEDEADGAEETETGPDEEGNEEEDLKALIKQAIKDAVKESFEEQGVETPEQIEPPPAPEKPPAQAPRMSKPEHQGPPAPVEGWGVVEHVDSPVGPTPIGEFRLQFLGGNAERIGNGSDTERPDFRFALPRAIVGMEGALGRYVFARGSVDLVGAQDNAPPWTVIPRDVTLDFDPGTDGVVRLRAGVQEPVFGSFNTLNPPASGYYTAGPSFATLAVVAGTVGGRDLGLVGTAFFEDARFDVGVFNGGGVSIAEDNPEKDLSARAAYTIADIVKVQASGLYGARGPAAFAADTLASGMMELRLERFRFMGEVILGSMAQAPENEETADVLGGQGAAALDVPLTSEVFDQLRFVAKTIAWDPNTAADDAAGWMVHNLATQLWWAGVSKEFVTTLGYEGYVPVNNTLPIEHTVVLEGHWRL